MREGRHTLDAGAREGTWEQSDGYNIPYRTCKLRHSVLRIPSKCIFERNHDFFAINCAYYETRCTTEVHDTNNIIRPYHIDIPSGDRAFTKRATFLCESGPYLCIFSSQIAFPIRYGHTAPTTTQHKAGKECTQGKQHGVEQELQDSPGFSLS